MMKSSIKNKLMTLLMATVAICGGTVIIYFGDKLLNVDLALYSGIDTFNPVWVLDLFVLPFIAGIFVSVVYGLGGKILAHFSPILILLPNYLAYYFYGAVLPEGSALLPIGFWILLLIVSVEFCALGGIIGEVVIKRTYGRSAKDLIHKKFQKVEN